MESALAFELALAFAIGGLVTLAMLFIWAPRPQPAPAEPNIEALAATIVHRMPELMRDGPSNAADTVAGLIRNELNRN